jgi:hypothetical protein
MIFVKARMCPLVEHSWLLLIDDSSLGYAKRKIDSINRAACESLYCHGSNVFVIEKRIQATEHLLSVIDSRIGWFMNSFGGMCPNIYDELCKVEADDFPLQFKPSDIKITKFDDGKHWYTIFPNGERLKYNGMFKWSTPELARSAVKRFCGE